MPRLRTTLVPSGVLPRDPALRIRMARAIAPVAGEPEVVTRFVSALPSGVWNVEDKNGAVTLSNGDMTVVSAANPAGIHGSTLRSLGKRYFEVVVDRTNLAASSPMIGIAKADQFGTGTEAYLILTSGVSFYIYGTGFVGGSLGIANGDVVMVAVSFDDHLIWFGLNGVWLGGGDPEAGTDAIASIDSGRYFPHYWDTNTSGTPGQGTARFTEDRQQYPLPDGYSAWG